MTLPSAVFGLLCSLLLGALFHLLVDGGPRRMVLYMTLSTVGFFGANWLASSLGWSLLPVGPIQMGVAVFGSVAILVLGNWLSKFTVEPRGRNRTV